MNVMYNRCGKVFLLIVAMAVVLCSSACSKITITLNANGGLVNGKSSIKHTITNGDSFDKVPDPTREGYNFDGWYTSATGGTKITKNSPAPTKNTTYYAHWTAKQITITWSANGGSPNSSGKRKVGTKMTLCTSTPTREGYSFDGWYTAKTGGTKITTSTNVPTKNTTYYAHWKAKQVTIIWHPNEGSPSYTGTRTVGTLMKLCSSTPTRKGYSFQGWYTAPTGGTKITTSTIVPTKDTTYYAHWTKSSATEVESPTLPTQPTQPTSPILPSWSVDKDRVMQGTLKIDAKLYEDKECKTGFDGSMSQGGSVYLRGSVTSKDNNITKINAGFKDNAGTNWLKVGTKQYPVTVTPNAKTYDLQKIDGAISFGNLGIGKYKFVIEATNAYGEKLTFSADVEVNVIVVYAKEYAKDGKNIIVKEGDVVLGKFYGSINPTKEKNSDGCGTAKILAGTYKIMLWTRDYKGHGASAYTIQSAGSTKLNGYEKIPCTRQPYPDKGCITKKHDKNSYTEARVHQAPLNAGGSWSVGCITVQGSVDNGKEEMEKFSNLVGNEAILIVER